MPAQTTPRRRGLKRTPRQGLPHPGEGGYDYPRGPYGKTGFPGSTPAARPTHTQRDPEGARGTRQLDARQAQAEWADLPSRRPGGDPRQPRARTGRETAGERRMWPRIGADAPGDRNQRNTVYYGGLKAVPGELRSYRPAPNPGKTGARLNGPSEHHPDTWVWGHPDGTPVPGHPADVTVCSRYVSDHGAENGYAMNRPEEFDAGGVAAWPGSYRGDRHLRGGRLDGTRYFGALADQQKIGLPSDSYGLHRARGPNHRPVRFEQPAPWSAHYYDVPPEQGTQAPDMIHRSPAGAGRRGRRVRRG